MLTMLPPPPASIAGRNALMVRCMDLTLRSKEKSQSSSEQSMMVPWCTKPAALSRMSVLPTRLAKASTSAVLRTSSRAVSAMPSVASVARPFSSTSVAITVAPSRANAMAQARPMPAAAAVTTARLPFRRSEIQVSSKFVDIVISSLRGAKRRSNPASLSRRRKLDCFASLAMTVVAAVAFLSVIIPRHADLAGDIVVARGELHAGAGGLLADGVAIDLLPGRLVRREAEAALRLQLDVTLLHLVIGDEDIGAALVEVDADLVAGAQDCKATVGGSFRRGVEDRRRARRAGLP